MILGTPGYLPPERLAGRPATPASDLYSVGVLLYEALSGRPPFEGPTPVAVAKAIQSNQPPPLAELGPGLADHLVAAVARAMERDPGRRFAIAAEMAQALSGPSPTETQPLVLTETTAFGVPARKPVWPALDRRPMVAGAGAARIDVEAGDGYASDDCAGRCVVLFQLDAERPRYRVVKLEQDRRMRLYVVDNGDRTVVISIVAPSDGFERSIAAAEAVVKSLSVKA